MSLISEGGQQGGTTTDGAGAGAGGTSGNAGSAGAGAAGAGAGSGQTTSWRDALPEDIRGSATLTKFNDVSALAKSYVELQGVIGKKGIFPPGDKATKEQWGEFYKQIGQPEFEKFAVKTPEGKQYNKELIEAFRKTAHESGLLPQQAQGVLDWFLGAEEAHVKAQSDAKAATMKTQHEELKKEWGEGFGKQIHAARTAAREIGGEKFAEYLETSGLGNDVQIIKMLAQAGSLLSEDKLRGDGAGGKFGQTPAEIQDEINKVFADMSHPYFNKSHAGHAQAVREMEARYKRLNGGQ